MEQSKLPGELRGKLPRRIDDLKINEVAYVHADSLAADSEWGMWIDTSSVIYRKPPIRWEGLCLVIRPVSGAMEVDVSRLIDRWRYVRGRAPDQMPVTGRFVPCVLSEEVLGS